MSIAVSAVVRPSRQLLAMVVAMSAGTALLFFATAIAADRIPPQWRLPLIASGLFLAAFGFYHGAAKRKTIHIDISGNGEIRLRDVIDPASCDRETRPHLTEDAACVRLLAGSTLWPRLLVLRLQDDNGNITVLPILPDSVSSDSFRALSVACQWVAAHGNPDQRERAANRVHVV